MASRPGAPRTRELDQPRPAPSSDARGTLEGSKDVDPRRGKKPRMTEVKLQSIIVQYRTHLRLRTALGRCKENLDDHAPFPSVFPAPFPPRSLFFCSTLVTLASPQCNALGETKPTKVLVDTECFAARQGSALLRVRKKEVRAKRSNDILQH